MDERLLVSRCKPLKPVADKERGGDGASRDHRAVRKQFGGSGPRRIEDQGIGPERYDSVHTTVESDRHAMNSRRGAGLGVGRFGAGVKSNSIHLLVR